MFQRLLSYPLRACGVLARRMSLRTWVGLLCLSGVFLLTAATNQSPCTEAIDADDCEVLVLGDLGDLGDVLRGAGGAALNWDIETPITEWTGVTIDPETKRVTRIDLRDLDLQGTIPASLGLLTGLERLWLAGNQLTGEIPLELGNLSNLEWIALRGNQLTGCLPDEFSNIPYSDVSQLGLPFCATIEHATLLEIRDALVGDGTALNWAEDLDVSEWDGVGLSYLERVTSLSLSEHDLRGTLPAELGNLVHLGSLNFSRNLLDRRASRETGSSQGSTLAESFAQWSNRRDSGGTQLSLQPQFPLAPLQPAIRRNSGGVRQSLQTEILGALLQPTVRPAAGRVDRSA